MCPSQRRKALQNKMYLLFNAIGEKNWHLISSDRLFTGLGWVHFFHIFKGDILQVAWFLKVFGFKRYVLLRSGFFYHRLPF